MSGPAPLKAATGTGTLLSATGSIAKVMPAMCLAPLKMVTRSVPSKAATGAETLLATSSVARVMADATSVSDSFVDLSASKILGLAPTSAEAARFSTPVESMVAVTLAELEAGCTPILSDASVIPAKFKPASKHERPEANQSQIMTQTNILEQETRVDFRLSKEESNTSTVRSSSASSDDETVRDVEEEVEPPMKKGKFMKTEAMGKCSDCDFLLRHEQVFSEALSDTPTVLEKLSNCIELEESEKQEFLECCKIGESEPTFQRLLEKAKDGQIADVQTVMYVLELCRNTHPGVDAAFLQREKILNAVPEPTGSQQAVKTILALLLEHKEELIQSITELSPIVECLDTADDGFLSKLEKKVILDCCEGRSHREAMEKLLEKVKDEKALRVVSLVKLLQAVKEAFPDLSLMLDALESQGKITAPSSPEEYGFELLKQHHENLAEILTDPQMFLRGLATAVNLAPRERKVMEHIVKKDSCGSSFRSLASAVLEEKTLPAMAFWQLLLALQEGEIPLNTLLEDIQREPGAELFFQSVVKKETVATEILLRHSELITAAIRESEVRESLTPGEGGLADAVKSLLSALCEKEECGTSYSKQFLTSTMEKSFPTLKFCQLLCSLHESFPNLQPLMQELEQMGLLTERDGEMKDIRKWKVNNEYQIEALVKDEGLNPVPMEVIRAITDCGKDKSVLQKKKGKRVAISSSKRFICTYCNKIFHFRCRLKVHVKRCKMAHEKHLKCPECNQTMTSKKEMDRHMLEAHNCSSSGKTARGRKRLLVTCDICGKEFAHPSGMQYHKRSEHFDEKPFSCNECGAKFAANSTLKNHQRLHTGERPFMCKHCHMTFTQAAALAYHTKKKHSEGKMYVCQYCNGVFAQSIELTRHVRTHTGDKPYVCRECGKGFSQANGLSVHLRTFHNIEDAYDCQKCRMSFTALDEHRKHIQEVHSKEYHPCSTCGKIFSAPSLLERHMVSHVGGKPYNCEICDKAYQQLSGIWYHNRTHHPDIFAAQNHRTSKLSSLQCPSCCKGFPSTAALQKHVKTDHAELKLPECEHCQQIFLSPAALQVHMKFKHSGSQPFKCLYCSDAFQFPGALQHHVAAQHFSERESTFGCQLCGELFTSQLHLQKHYESEHSDVVIAERQETSAQVVQVIHTAEQIDSSEQVITMDESQLAASQLIVTVPDSQGGQNGSELLAVCMKDLLDGTVTLICGETK